MLRSRHNVLVAIGVGLLSDVWPIPGVLLAAVVFREGIHSSQVAAYATLSLVLNFSLFGGLAYLLLAAIQRHRILIRSVEPAGEVVSNRPMKGIIYTDSEIAEMKERGRV